MTHVKRLLLIIVNANDEPEAMDLTLHGLAPGAAVSEPEARTIAGVSVGWRKAVTVFDRETGDGWRIEPDRSVHIRNNP